MYFGFTSVTTDTYDQGYCSNSDYTEYGDCVNNGANWVGDQYAPPAPPGGTFDAALTWDSDRFYSQLIDGSVENAGIEHEFGLSLAYDSYNLIYITWDSVTWSNKFESAVLQDAFGGAMINVNMLYESSVTLDNPAFTQLKLLLTPSLQGLELPLNFYDNGTITSVVPNHAEQGESLTVSITGQDTHFIFYEGSSTTDVHLILGDEIIESEWVEADDNENLDTYFNIPSDATLGEWDVSVTYSYGDGWYEENYLLVNGFTINLSSPEETLVSIEPDNAQQGETLTVTITGQDTHFGFWEEFEQGSETTWEWVGNVDNIYFGKDTSIIYFDSWNELNETLLTANVTIPTNSPTGPWNVSAHQGGGYGTVTLEDGFIITEFEDTECEETFAECETECADSYTMDTAMCQDFFDMNTAMCQEIFVMNTVVCDDSLYVCMVECQADEDCIADCNLAYNDCSNESEMDYNACNEESIMIYESCFTEVVTNYFECNADCQLDFDECTNGEEDVYGCTDPLAVNYNPDATVDDGSCEYEDTEGPDFSVSITAISNAAEYELIFGFSPNATDGYDPDFDQYAPPLPPPPIFDVALNWEGDRYYTQIINGSVNDLVEHIWDVQLQYSDSDTNAITIAWGFAEGETLGLDEIPTTQSTRDLIDESLGEFYLQDAFGGEFIDINMVYPWESYVSESVGFLDLYDTLGIASLYLYEPSINALKLKVTPNYEEPPPPPPPGSIVSIEPDSAEQGDSLWVTITGQNTHFRIDAGSETYYDNVNSVYLSGGDSNINAGNWDIFSETELLAYFGIPNNSPTGLWDVNVSQGSGYGTAVFDSGFTIQPSSEYVFTSVSVGFVNTYPGEVVAVPVNVVFPEDSTFSSAWLSFSGYQDGLNFIGVDTDSTLAGLAGWVVEANETDSLLITASAGAENIGGEGVLFRLMFSVHEYVTGFIPITLVSALFDESEIPVSMSSGGVNVIEFIPGDVSMNGSITPYDASLILKYIVDYIELNPQQLLNANVSPDTTVSALDASLILQYCVGLIENLPYDSIGSLFAAGDITMNNSEIQAGQPVAIPLHLTDGINILSFEGLISFNPEHLTFSEIIWSEFLENFSIEVNSEDGELLVAGAGTLPDGEQGVFGTLVFTVHEELIEDETVVALQTLRWNEESVMEDVAAAVLYRTQIYDAVAFNPNWNLISFDIEIEDNTPEDVFAELIESENLIYVTGYIEEGFVFFDPNGPFFLNTLLNLEPGDGYWVKLFEPANIVQLGYQLPDSYAIDLLEGWDMIAYWIQESSVPEEAFFELIESDNLIYVTGFVDGEAVFFDPNGLSFLNTLTSLDNGYGYWVKVNEAVENFQYPTPSGEMTKQVVRNVNNDIIRTNVFMFINGTLTLEDIELEEDTRVNIFTESGLLVGEMDIVNNNYLRTGAVYGDDRTTEAVDGALEGEDLVFRYKNYESEPVSISFAGNMELAKVDLIFRNIPETFTLYQNFPNPFNPITTLSYDLPKDSDVRLAIFDMLGNEVNTLVSSNQQSGLKSVKWDATDNMGRPVSAGVYLYQIQAGEFVQTKKMVLLK